jgi:type IV pilus assembly protein PilE
MPRMSHTIRRRYRGFSLLELMVVVAILAVIASIAYPSYLGFVTRTNRTAAKSALVLIADRQQQFFAQNKRYAATLTALGYADDTIMIDAKGDYVPDASDDRVYRVELTNTAPMTFTVNATPQLRQAGHDTDCGSMTLTHTGIKGQSGTATNCW